MKDLFDQRIYKRYGIKCFCGNYTPYKSTLIPGRMYAMMMQPDDCVNCRENKRKQQNEEMTKWLKK